MLKTCEIHGVYEAETFFICGRTFEMGCPECDRLGSLAEKIKAEKAKEKARCFLLIRRGIEPEYQGRHLGDYIAETESEKKALQSAWDLKNGVIKKLVLVGRNGTGKTMLGSILAQECGGIIITMFALSARIRAGYSEGLSEYAVLMELLEYDFICIDELGRTKGSEAERNWLSFLIDKCHVRGKKLMILSNRLMAKDLSPDRKGEALETFFDNDIVSRLRDARIIKIDGRDRRTVTTV